MSHAYIIEVAGQTAGIIAADTRGFRFHVSNTAFQPLEGRAFSTPQAAERAARALLRQSGRRVGR
jgi:hypothetical protein